jgi:hypothetical protein
LLEHENDEDCEIAEKRREVLGKAREKEGYFPFRKMLRRALDSRCARATRLRERKISYCTVRLSALKVCSKNSYSEEYIIILYGQSLEPMQIDARSGTHI